MSSTHAEPYERRCSKCGALFSTGAPGAAWFTRKRNPRYIHPGCQRPAKDWKPACTRLERTGLE